MAQLLRRIRRRWLDRSLQRELGHTLNQIERKVSVAWEIVARPAGRNRDNRNEGGLVIELRSGASVVGEEIGRVAFERSNSLHPDVSYEDQVDIEVQKAVKTVQAIRELQSTAGELQ